MLIVRFEQSQGTRDTKNIIDNNSKATFLFSILGFYLMILKKWLATRRSWCDNFIQVAKQSIVWKEVSQALKIALLHLKQNNPHKNIVYWIERKRPPYEFAIRDKFSSNSCCNRLSGIPRCSSEKIWKINYKLLKTAKTCFHKFLRPVLLIILFAASNTRRVTKPFIKEVI